MPRRPRRAVKAGEDAAETFEPAEQSFDLVAVFCKAHDHSPTDAAGGLGGTTGIMARSSASCRVSSPL
jgi:hypothetical protein